MPQITYFLTFMLWISLASVAGITLITSSAFLYLSPKLPSVETLKDVELQTPMSIYTKDGVLIGEFGEKRRTPISFEDIPPLFIDAILAAEDDRFFSHHGVDIKGLLRASSQLLTTGSIQSGGSTITMQVAKNYFLSHERTFLRKFNEIFLALQIEQQLSKQEILELYLNKIFLGNRAYGIEAAAKVYYGKSIKELELSQFAMLAGLPKAPSSYNPIVNPSRALIRRNWILGRMLTLKRISQFDYQAAIQAPITAKRYGTQLSINAAYVAEIAHQEIYERYGNDTYSKGYKVFTTIDSKLQASAQQAVVDGLMAYDSRHGYRGPEQQLPPNVDGDTLSLWRSTLDKTPTLGGLVPAIVTAINDDSFQALLVSGDTIMVPWLPELAKTRSFITINSTSPIASIAQVVAVGDLIRLKKDSYNVWQLSQLPAAQAALVSLDSSNGAILSLVGGFDYQHSKFNRITQAKRQPGSNFKPFIYTAGLAKGFTPASIINDAPIVFEDTELESTWRPTNSSGKFLGPTRLRKALYQSRNLVSIRLLRSIGITSTINYVSRFGFDSQQLPKDLSLALGSHSLSPLEIVNAYAILANGGYAVKAHLIDHIETFDGDILPQPLPATVYPETASSNSMALAEEESASISEILNTSASAPKALRVVDERVAFLIDSMLRDVVKKGTGQKAQVLKRNDLAGKTGTTNGPTDAWFSGYGGGIVTTTWLGFDNNDLIGTREYGGSAALPIWIDYMKTALAKRPEINPSQPEGVISVKIDPLTGLLARPGQKEAIFEYFRSEDAPQKTSSELPKNSTRETVFEQEDIF